MLRAIVAALSVALLVALDQLTKWMTWTFIPLDTGMDVLPGLDFAHVHNEGIAFSMFDGAGRWPLLLLATGVLAVVLYLWRQAPPGRWLAQAGFALIVAGALGNIIDRAAWGYVVDMIALTFPRPGGGTWSFAVFNVADSYISIGAACVIVDELVLWVQDRRQRKEAS